MGSKTGDIWRAGIDENANGNASMTEDLSKSPLGLSSSGGFAFSPERSVDLRARSDLLQVTKMLDLARIQTNLYYSGCRLNGMGLGVLK
jgi:hypothetical protein